MEKTLIEHGTTVSPWNAVGYTLAVLLLIIALIVTTRVIVKLYARIEEKDRQLREQAEEQLEFIKRIKTKQREPDA